MNEDEVSFMRHVDRIMSLLERKRKGHFSPKGCLEEYIALRFCVFWFERVYGVISSSDDDELILQFEEVSEKDFEFPRALPNSPSYA